MQALRDAEDWARLTLNDDLLADRIRGVHEALTDDVLRGSTLRASDRWKARLCGTATACGATTTPTRAPERAHGSSGGCAGRENTMRLESRQGFRLFKRENWPWPSAPREAENMGAVQCETPTHKEHLMSRTFNSPASRVELRRMRVADRRRRQLRQRVTLTQRNGRVIQPRKAVA